MLTKELKEYRYCPRCKSNLTLTEIDSNRVRKCEACGFLFWNNPKPVVSIILHKDRKILMLQRAKEPFKNFWVLPGGFIGYQESAQEATKREAKEETGLDIVINGLIGVYRIDNDPRGIHIDIIFHGTADGKTELSEEDKTWRLFSPDKLPEHIAYKHRNAINDWHRKGNQYG